MNKQELDEALRLHKTWLNNEDGGKRADLRGADLRGAVLTGADIDYSCWPLWCGSKGVKVDVRIVRQLLAHVACLDCDDPAFAAIKASILPEARKSHRAAELGLLDNQTGEQK